MSSRFLLLFFGLIITPSVGISCAVILAQLILTNCLTLFFYKCFCDSFSNEIFWRILSLVFYCLSLSVSAHLYAWQGDGKFFFKLAKVNKNSYTVCDRWYPVLLWASASFFVNHRFFGLAVEHLKFDSVLCLIQDNVISLWFLQVNQSNYNN